MKLTWFGGTALRVYLGGEIVVIDPDEAPAGVNRAELLAGAAHVVRMGDSALSSIDPSRWRPRQAARPLHETAVDAVELMRIGAQSVLVAAAGEPPLVVLGPGDVPRFGRWADGAVLVLTSLRESLVAEATVLLDVARPRLLALALDGDELDAAVAALAEHLDGAGLVSLEPGLAVEV